MVTKRGFSLIELTVVIGLISLLTLAITSALLMSVVSSNRIRTATKIKQAGNFALDQMQGLIRNARNLDTCDSAGGSITVNNPDGGTTTLTQESDGNYTRVASNSGIYLTPSNLEVTNFTLACTPSDSTPSLITITFDLHDPQNLSSRESPTLHFETAVNLRN